LRNIAEGTTFKRVFDLADKLGAFDASRNDPVAGAGGRASSEGFSTSPKPSEATDKGAAGRAGKELLRARRQLLDALAKLQEARAKSELDLAKAVNEEIRSGWQSRYDDGLVAVRDFYLKKHELDTADIAAEQNFLNAKKRNLIGF